MSTFWAELVGTALLLLLGNGAVANVVLRRTKGEGSGWLLITWGWGMAVFVGVFVAARYSGAHLNPAVTLGLAMSHNLAWTEVPLYLGAQMIGAALGAVLVWFHYRDHLGVTEDRDAKLAVFCTGPAIRSVPANLFSEALGTFVLVLGVLFLAKPDVGLGALDALPVGLLVFAIGVSLGGTTGYAINPARDLAPRIMHALLPIPGGKRDSDWGYSWVPIVGPLIGGAVAALVFMWLGRPMI